MANKFGVRYFCLDPDGNIYKITLNDCHALHRSPLEVIIPEFSGQTIRFVECDITIEDRRPAKCLRMVYYLIRFDSNGAPDIERYNQDSQAAMSLVWDSVFPRNCTGNVIDLSERFQSNGSKWKPTIAISKRIDDALFEAVKVPRIKLHKTSDA